MMFHKRHKMQSKDNERKKRDENWEDKDAFRQNPSIISNREAEWERGRDVGKDKRKFVIQAYPLLSCFADILRKLDFLFLATIQFLLYMQFWEATGSNTKNTILSSSLV